MKIIKKISECKSIINSLKRKRYKIGLVPTMGFLHEGHLSLIRIAKKECDKVFVSIFVNPIQFSPGEDFERYPRDIKRDGMLAGKEGVDYIFNPEANEMYGPDYKTKVEVGDLGSIMCGKHRPGHFAGVATVVLKLFNIINADKAYFGEKDYQQVVIIKKMVGDLNLDIDIVSGPTIREKDGIALSSRNKYLSEEERENAVILYKSLKAVKDFVKQGEKDLEKIKRMATKDLKENEFIGKIDYFEFRDPLTLCEIKKVTGKQKKLLVASAVWVGKTRLIDNMVIRV